jgi:hypothetical protein
MENIENISKRVLYMDINSMDDSSDEDDTDMGI